jgi:hypothetical protein
MRFKAVVCCAGLAPLAGCNLAYYTGYNLANLTVTRVDEYKLSKRLRAEARAAWREVCNQYPGRAFSDEFVDGFEEGYADYLENGRAAQPPAVPPPRYRRSRYLTPEGHARIRDYFAGFKYGADVAVATGRREFLTVPVLLPEPRPEPPFNFQFPAPPEAGPVPLGAAAVAGGWVLGLGLQPPVPPIEMAPATAPLPAPTPVVPPPDPGAPVPPKPEANPPAGESAEPPPASLKPTAAEAERGPAPVAPPEALPPAVAPPPARPPVPAPPAPVPAAPNPNERPLTPG